MKKYKQLIDRYSSEMYFLYSKTISKKKWGDKDIALEYLKKFSLPDEDYFEIWRPIQNSIFNICKGLPELVFKKEFSLLAIRGGILFEEEEFEILKKSLQKIGDKKLIIIQNDFGGKIETPFRMIFPANISWTELMSGNFISTVIFEMFANEYFVFSESGNWGKYSANDYEQPLDIIGCKPEYTLLFSKQFEQSKEEQDEIREWLPITYKNLIKWGNDID